MNVPAFYELMDSREQGVRFRYACDELVDEPQLVGRSGVAAALEQAGIPCPPARLTNAAQEAIDFMRHGVRRLVEGPLQSTAEYFIIEENNNGKDF